MLGIELPSGHYDEVYANSAAYRTHYADSLYYFLWCVLVDRIHPDKVSCLFDVGCGPGQFASFLRVRGLRRYVGLDFSKECIRMARTLCPEYRFVCGDAFTTDLFETLNYDVLVTTEFLEHVKKDLEIIGAVRAGTRVYASVPNFPYPGHVRHFTSSEDVVRRYGSWFDQFRVDEFLCGSKGASFFIFEGIRNAERPEGEGSRANCSADA